MATQDVNKTLSRADQLRHALQAPIAGPKYCVLFTRNGAERRTPWLYSLDRAQRALEICTRQFGPSIIYVD